MMKAAYYIGLTRFILGIILFFLREIEVSYLSDIKDFWIDILWPAGLMIYSVALIFIEKEKPVKS